MGMGLLRRASLFVLCTLSLAIFACVGSGCGADEASAEVTLENAGDGPKRTLRFNPAVGSIQRSTLRMEIEIDQQMQGMSQSLPVPVMTLVTDTTVDAVHEDGRIECNYSIIDAQTERTSGVEPFVRMEVQRALDDMIGTTGSLTMTPRGEIVESNVNIPSGASAETRQMLQELEDEMAFMAIRFPEEPVGAGAVWTVVENGTYGGMKQTVTTTYTVEAINGEEVTLDIKVHSTAPEQTMELAELPPGAEVELTSHEAYGWGSMTLDLRWPDPIEGSLKINGEQSLTASYGGQRMSIDQQPRAKLAIATTQTLPERVAPGSETSEVEPAMSAAQPATNARGE